MEEESITRESFVFYKTFSDTIRELDSESQLKLFWAINDYALFGKEPKFSGILKALWIPISFQLSRSLKRYEACVKNGKKGGAPKGSRNNPNGRKGKNKQELTKELTKEFTENKPETNLNDNYNYNDNNLESNKLDSSSTLQVDPSESKIEKSSKKPEIDYVALANFFNSTLEKEHSTISRITAITGKRKGFVDARNREYGKEAILKVIIMASKSDFLNGKNEKGWIADFNWIFRPNNFPKVLEGNFNNNTNGTTQRNAQQGRSGTPSNGIPFKGKIVPGCGLIED